VSFEKLLLHKFFRMCIIIEKIHIQGDFIMRTNVVLDDDLVKSALSLSGIKTKKKAIEEGLKLLIQVNRQQKIKDFRGKLKWTGNLNKMRTDK
jgi:Arc/MetJ family transcription regulator